MVYLECPRCETVTEHQIIGLRKDRVITRCTECMYEWRGDILCWVPEHSCPTCKGALKQVNKNPDYWMCYSCIKGYTTYELERYNEEKKGVRNNEA